MQASKCIRWLIKICEIHQWQKMKRLTYSRLNESERREDDINAAVRAIGFKRAWKEWSPQASASWDWVNGGLEEMTRGTFRWPCDAQCRCVPPSNAAVCPRQMPQCAAIKCRCFPSAFPFFFLFPACAFLLLSSFSSSTDFFLSLLTVHISVQLLWGGIRCVQ